MAAKKGDITLKHGGNPGSSCSYIAGTGHVTLKNLNFVVENYKSHKVFDFEYKAPTAGAEAQTSQLDIINCTVDASGLRTAAVLAAEGKTNYLTAETETKTLDNGNTAVYYKPLLTTSMTGGTTGQPTFPMIHAGHSLKLNVTDSTVTLGTDFLTTASADWLNVDVTLTNSTLDGSAFSSYVRRVEEKDASGKVVKTYLEDDQKGGSYNPAFFALTNQGTTTLTMTDSTAKCSSTMLTVAGQTSTVSLTNSKLIGTRASDFSPTQKQKTYLFGAKDTVQSGSFTATDSELAWSWRGFVISDGSTAPETVTLSFDTCRFRLPNIKLGGGDGFAIGRAINYMTVKNSVLEFDNAVLDADGQETGEARDFDLGYLSASCRGDVNHLTMENNLIALRYEAPNAWITYYNATKTDMTWLPSVTESRLAAELTWRSLDEGVAYPYLYGSRTAVALWADKYEACGYTTASSNFSGGKLGGGALGEAVESKWGKSTHGAQGDNKYYKFYYENSQFTDKNWQTGKVPTDAFFAIPISHGAETAPLLTYTDCEYFTVDFELMTESDFISLTIALQGRNVVTTTEGTSNTPMGTDLLYLSYSPDDRSLQLSSNNQNTHMTPQTVTGIDPYQWLHFTVVVRVALTENGTVDGGKSQVMLYLDGQPLYEEAYAGVKTPITNLHSIRIITKTGTALAEGATVCIDNVTSRAYGRSPYGVALLDAVLANTRTAGKTLDELGYTAYRTYDDRHEVCWEQDGETLKSGRYTTGATATYQDTAVQDGYVQTVGRWDNEAYASYTVADDKTFTRTEVRRTYVSGMKQNLSLFSDFDINLYIPLLEGETLTATATLGGDALPMREVTLDGQRYWCVTLGCASNATVDTVYFYLQAEGATVTRVSLSVLNYATRVLTSDEAALTQAKPLMMYMLTYSRAAYSYFAAQQGEAATAALAAIDALLTEQNKSDYMGKTLTHPDAVEVKEDDSVLYSASLVLESAPTLRFYFNEGQTAGGFAGTVRFTYVDYLGVTRTCVQAVTADKAYVELSELRVYNFDATVTVETAATGEAYKTALSYNLSAYADYVHSLDETTANVTELTGLIDALADYVRVAADYKTAMAA